MTLEEKLDASIILNQKKMPLKKIGILTPKQRRRSLVVFILMLIFTIYTKFILKSFSFDFLAFFIILNLVTLFILKLMSKSTTALNHRYIYRFVVFLNKVCKVAIFAFSIVGYYEHFKVYIPENYTINSKEDLPEVLFDLLKTDFKFISFIGTVILFIPTFIYFIIFFMNYYVLPSMAVYLGFLAILIPGLNLYLIYRIVTYQKNTFLYYYLDEDGTSVIVETREFQSPIRSIQIVLLKILILIPIIIIIGFFYYQIAKEIFANQ
ncbi:MAG: hypothetical protein K2O22_01235 [Anaeroplasmataceae bacterium]|nr:hypothetical protein [Anaeroplasmataceae bacterium]